MIDARTIGLAIGLAALAWDPAATAGAPKLVALLVVAMVLAIHGDARRRPPLAALAWLGSVALGLPHATRADALGALVGASLLLALLRWPAERVRELAQHTAAVTALAALAVVGQALLGARGSHLHGGQGNPDWLALLLAAALPLTIASAHAPAADRRRWLAVALQLLGLAIARSRSAWLAAAVALAVLAHRRWLWALLAVGGATTIALALPALEGRLWIAGTTLDVIGRHPLLGTAFGPAFADAQGDRLRTLALAEAAQRFVLPGSAHNDWLQAAAEGGLLSLALLVVAFALAWRAHRAWPAGRAAVLAIAVAALGDAPLHQAAVLALFVALLAAAPSADGPPGRALLVPAIGVLSAFVVPHWLAERLATRARDEAPEPRAATLQLALRLDPTVAAFDAGLCALQAGAAARAVELLEQDRARRWQPATELALADALHVLGQPERALAIDDALLHLAPGSVRARLARAQALRALGRDDEARDELAVAHRLWPSLPAIAALGARLDEDRR